MNPRLYILCLAVCTQSIIDEIILSYDKMNYDYKSARSFNKKHLKDPVFKDALRRYKARSHRGKNVFESMITRYHVKESDLTYGISKNEK